MITIHKKIRKLCQCVPTAVLFLGCFISCIVITNWFTYENPFHNNNHQTSPNRQLVSLQTRESFDNQTRPQRNGSLTQPLRKYMIIDWTLFQPSHSDFQIGNCIVTSNRSLVASADAIAITIRRLRKLANLPKIRSPWQRWIWLLDESPFHAMMEQNYRLDALNGLFNWTMTYKRESDITIPYGWTFRRDSPHDIPDFIGKQTELVSAVLSNKWFIHNRRFEYMKQLQKHINVTIYGQVGKHCDGMKRAQLYQPCPKVKNYKFFLAFENSNCKEYITEKAFIHGLSFGPIPVVLGASKEDYMKLLPPNSFIYAEDFKTPKDLANYLLYLSQNATEFMKFHEWRRTYDVDYRIQYVDDKIWYPLCAALENNNSSYKVYTHLENQFQVSDDCEKHIIHL